MLWDLRHRGPDGSVIADYGDLTLGFCRLRIVGPPGLDQPVSVGASVTAINGEIYNHRQLTVGLSATFRQIAEQGSDCCIVAHLQDSLGLDFLSQLDGMFAGVCFDADLERLSLFRDHLGMKPIHFARLESGVAFASSTEALTRLVAPAVDADALFDYLLTGYVQSPCTLLRGVADVPPGSVVTFDSAVGRPEIRRWFSFDSPIDHDVRSVIEESIRSEADIDGPLFCAVSGGLDSGVVAAVASASRKDLVGITVSYKDVPNDPDVVTARRLCEDLNMAGVVVELSSDDYRAELEQGWLYDQPLSDPNAIAFGRACREVSARGGRVFLTGDGADELFCGYPYYARAVANSHLLSFASATVFTSMTDATDRRFVRLVTGRHHARRLAIPRRSPLQHMQEVDILGWLEANILEKGDRIGMAHQVEVRAPFLRPRVVRAAFSIDDREKITPDKPTGKLVIRRAFADILPTYVINRPKQGFMCPIDVWLRGRLGADLACEATWSVDDQWDVRAEQLLWEEHRSGLANWGQQLWRTSVARVWWRTMLARQSGSLSE